MAFYFVCEHCQRRMKVPNSVAGQEIRCFACRQKTRVPELVSRASQSLMEQGVQDLVPGFVRRTYAFLEPKLELVAPPFQPAPLVYLIFVILFLPILVLSKSTNEYQRRINEIIETSAKEVSPYAHAEVDLDKLAMQLPQHKIPGALLPRDTKIHWFYGAVAWVGTLIFLLLIFPRGSATLLQLSTVAFFTATVGVAGLLFLQLLAMASFQTVGMVGWMALIVIILRVFALAYICAFMPGVSFWASLFGFIVGVGICEEFFKALPFLSQSKHMHKTSYQTVCIWGLASGMGFGIAEGLFYSARFYNGFAPGPMYLMRFTSCVALHASLTAAAALMFYKHDKLISERSIVSWLAVVIMALTPSALLHGLYDTLLKHQMAPAALFIAVLSFLWMTLQIELAHNRVAEVEEVKAAEPEVVLSAAMTEIIGDQSKIDAAKALEAAKEKEAAGPEAPAADPPREDGSNGEAPDHEPQSESGPLDEADPPAT